MKRVPSFPETSTGQSLHEQMPRLTQEALAAGCGMGRYGRLEPASKAILACVFLMATVPCQAAILSVGDDKPADFPNIQAAVDGAHPGDTILVQPGIYRGRGNRDIDFRGKAIVVRSTNPLDPATVSATVIDCQGTLNDHHQAFIFHSQEGERSVIDGLTLTGGNAHYGGAVGGEPYCSPTIQNCVIRGNFAEGNGGGINCITSKTRILNCLIEGNTAREYGGGVRTCEGSDLAIVNSIIRNNSSGDDGGGFECCRSNATVSGCLFEGNVSGAEGGGIWCLQTATVEHCTIIGNQAHLVGGGLSCNRDRCAITNSIIRDNRPDNFYIFNDDTTISYCNRTISDHYPGVGNMDVDPRFAKPGQWMPNPGDPQNVVWVPGDYHLKSRAGRWDPVNQRWLIDDVTSPCVDAGDPDAPVAFEPYPNGGIVDIGAYGGAPEASKSPSGLHAKYGGGRGEPGVPYLVYTVEHLNRIGLERDDWSRYFKLMADIDLSGLMGADFHPVGRDAADAFTGVFDGNGKRIIDFRCTSRRVGNTGLFGYVAGENAEIKHLGLLNPHVDAGLDDFVGSLVGYLGAESRVTHCYAKGGSVIGVRSVGGLVGGNGGILTRSYASSSVSGDSDVGGLVGRNSHVIANCYAAGSVAGTSGVGGLVGRNTHTIDKCYSSGHVGGAADTGGMVGASSGMITLSFWDITTSGQSISAGGAGKSATQMKTKNTFLAAGWDCTGEAENGTEDIWWIPEEGGYPRLLWESAGDDAAVVGGN